MFIKSFSQLYAKIWGLKYKDVDLEEALKEIKIPEFIPKDSAIEQIKKDVEKQEEEKVE